MKTRTSFVLLLTNLYRAFRATFKKDIGISRYIYILRTISEGSNVQLCKRVLQDPPSPTIVSFNRVTLRLTQERQNVNKIYWYARSSPMFYVIVSCLPTQVQYLLIACWLETSQWFLTSASGITNWDPLVLMVLRTQSTHTWYSSGFTD